MARWILFLTRNLSDRLLVSSYCAVERSRYLIHQRPLPFLGPLSRKTKKRHRREQNPINRLPGSEIQVHANKPSKSSVVLPIEPLAIHWPIWLSLPHKVSLHHLLYINHVATVAHHQSHRFIDLFVLHLLVISVYRKLSCFLSTPLR